MKAHPNFLHHVLPYLEDDPQTAIVQTPQHFFNVDHTGDVFNHQNSTFFFGVQVSLTPASLTPPPASLTPPPVSLTPPPPVSLTPS